MSAAPLKTFIIYARTDEDYKKQLLLHLRPLVNSRLLAVWHDGNILPGEDWEKAIKKELNSSELVVLLVSVNSLNSEFIQTEELRTALERLDAGLTRVVPIVVSPCAWRYDPVVNRLQALPQAPQAGLLPVSEWKNSDLAWASVVEQIGEMVQEVLEKRSEAERKELEKQARMAETAEQARLNELEKQKQAETEAKATQERQRRETEQARLAEQERQRQVEADAREAEARYAQEAEKTRLAEQGRQRLAEAALIAEREQSERERIARETKAQQQRQEAGQRRQEQLRQAAHDAAWQEAQRQDLVSAYDTFLSAYPASLHQKAAISRIKQLRRQDSKNSSFSVILRNRNVQIAGLALLCLLVFGVIKSFSAAEKVTPREPGAYLKINVLDGALVTADLIDYLPVDGLDQQTYFEKNLQGHCLNSPDNQQEIPKGTKITADMLGRCAGLYVAKDLLPGAEINTSSVILVSHRLGSPHFYEQLSDNLIHSDPPYCVKCRLTLKTGVGPLATYDVERCGGVYLKTAVPPGTVMTADLLEEVPLPVCQQKHPDVVYKEKDILGMRTPINQQSKTLPAGKLLRFSDF